MSDSIDGDDEARMISGCIDRFHFARLYGPKRRLRDAQFDLEVFAEIAPTAELRHACTEALKLLEVVENDRDQSKAATDRS